MKPRWLDEPGARHLFRDRGAASWVRLLWSGLVFFLFAAFLMPAMVPARLQLEAGQVSPKDIWAPRSIVDRHRMEALRAEARAGVPDFYRVDPGVWLRSEEKLTTVFAGLNELAADDELTGGERLARARQLIGTELADAVLLAVLAADLQDRERLAAAVSTTVSEFLRAGIKPDYVETARKQAAADLGAMDLDRNLRLLGVELTRQAIDANMFFDEHETRRKRQEAADGVEPVKIIQGQVVVRERDVITDHQMTILEDLGLLQTTPAYPARAGVILLAALLVAGLAFYLRLFGPAVYGSNQRVFLLSVIVAGSTGLIWAAGTFSGYLVPVAVGSMLATILLGQPIGLGVTILLTLLASLGAGAHPLVALVGGLAGVYGVATVAQRSDLVRSGLLVAGVNVVAILGLALAEGRAATEMSFWLDHVWGMANGFLSAVLTIGSLPFLENLFGIVTSLKLLELSNPNQPLLRRLLLEAPGTHHHSIMVANLAEAATERVGGEALLARVGAYYHDIGKVKRPYLFVENQLFGDDNPHDKLSPNLSALIITSHVRDGVELAQEENLPEALVDFVRQHHGTGLVTYFFQRATENGRAEEVVEQDFRYDGPVPNTRETAIVMLADACEASIRALHRPNPGRIENAVRKIIRERLDDGQLNQSDLTLRDLDAIAEEFTRLLTGFFHTRVQYPENGMGDLRAPSGGGTGVDGDRGRD